MEIEMQPLFDEKLTGKLKGDVAKAQIAPQQQRERKSVCESVFKKCVCMCFFV